MPLPNTVNDSVVYAPRYVYGSEDILLDVDEGSRLDIYGDVYLNGSRLATSGFDVRAFGAVGNNVADDTVSIQAAIDAASAAGGGTVVLPINGPWKTSSALIIKAGVRLEGNAGQWARINCTNAADDGIRISSSGLGGWAIKNIEVSGIFNTGVVCAPIPVASQAGLRGEMSWVKVSGTGTNGFRFANTYYSTFSNLSCEQATISNACFQILATVNGVAFSNLVTGGTNGHLYCVYMNNTEQPPGGSDLSAGRVVTFHNPVLQGGKFGLYVTGAQSLTVNNPYFENVAQPVVLGLPGASVTVQGVVFNGGYYPVCQATNPFYANRGPSFNIRNTRSATFNSPEAFGGNWYAINAAGGSGAAAVAYMLVDTTGSPVVYVVGSPGRAYSGTPTLTPPAPTTGTVDVLTAVLTTQRLTGVTLTTPGTTPKYTANLAYPVAVLYGEGTSKVTFNTPSMIGSSDFHPFHISIARDSTAASNNGVNVIGDAGSERHGLDMRKNEGSLFAHAVTYYDGSGLPGSFIRALPLIAAPA